MWVDGSVKSIYKNVSTCEENKVAKMKDQRIMRNARRYGITTRRHVTSETTP